MKNVLWIIAVSLAIVSCRTEKEESIHLGDYNDPDSTQTDFMPAGPSKAAPSESTDSITVDSLAVDSTVVDSVKNQENVPNAEEQTEQ